MHTASIYSPLLALLFTMSSSQAAPYEDEYVDHLNTRMAYQGLVDLGAMKVRVTNNYEVADTNDHVEKFPVDDLLAQFELAHQENEAFVEEQGRRAVDCKGTYSVHLFILSHQTMFFADCPDQAEGHHANASYPPSHKRGGRAWNVGARPERKTLHFTGVLS